MHALTHAHKCQNPEQLRGHTRLCGQPTCDMPEPAASNPGLIAAAPGSAAAGWLAEVDEATRAMSMLPPTVTAATAASAATAVLVSCSACTCRTAQHSTHGLDMHMVQPTHAEQDRARTMLSPSWTEHNCISWHHSIGSPPTVVHSVHTSVLHLHLHTCGSCCPFTAPVSHLQVHRLGLELLRLCCDLCMHHQVLLRLCLCPLRCRADLHSRDGLRLGLRLQLLHLNLCMLDHLLRRHSGLHRQGGGAQASTHQHQTQSASGTKAESKTASAWLACAACTH